MKVFIVNGGQVFQGAGGTLNKSISEWTKDFFLSKGMEVRGYDINTPYDKQEQVDNFVWADVVIYHTPIWWFSIPHKFKIYLDEVLGHGHQNGLYTGDGRSRKANPVLNYGTGGLLEDKKYMLLTTWNAPREAFTTKGEFFEETSVDNGAMFGFHKMNKFIGLNKMEGFHFYDVMKTDEDSINEYKKLYLEHLEAQFG